MKYSEQAGGEENTFTHCLKPSCVLAATLLNACSSKNERSRRVTHDISAASLDCWDG